MAESSLIVFIPGARAVELLLSYLWFCCGPGWTTLLTFSRDDVNKSLFSSDWAWMTAQSVIPPNWTWPILELPVLSVRVLTEHVTLLPQQEHHTESHPVMDDDCMGAASRRPLTVNPSFSTYTNTS